MGTLKFKGVSLYSSFVSAYLIYLVIAWLIFNYSARGIDPYLGSGYRWFVLYIGLFIFLAIVVALAVMYGKFHFKYSFKFALIYLTLISLRSFAALDVKHFFDVVVWTVPLLFFLMVRPAVSLYFLNFCFLVILFYSVFSFNPEYHVYGIFPGQTTTNLHQGLWWRVSLWLNYTPPYSAAFAMLVFWVNYLYLKNGIFKLIFCSSALYFLILSASRTSYLIFIMIGLYVFLVNREKLSSKSAKYMYFASSFLFVFVLQAFSFVLLSFDFDNQIISSAVLRNDFSGENLHSRFRIMQEHMGIFVSNFPMSVIGVGSAIEESNNWVSNGGVVGGSADSFITHLLVRDGILIVPLILSFVFLLRETIFEKYYFGQIVLLSILIFTVGYGAWMNMTSPVFVFYLSFIFFRREIISTDFR